MPSKKKEAELECSSRRGCIVVIEPSGDEYLLRHGQKIKFEAESESDFETKKLANGYSINLPDDTTILVDGQPVDGPPPFSISEILEVEFLRVPKKFVPSGLPDDFIAQVQTFDIEMDDVNPTTELGKLKALEVAAQISFEIVAILGKSQSSFQAIASVCMRILAKAAVIISTDFKRFGEQLYDAAAFDRKLGDAPVSLRRLLAASCIYPPSMANVIKEWLRQPSQDSRVKARRNDSEDSSHS